MYLRIIPTNLQIMGMGNISHSINHKADLFDIIPVKSTLLK